MNLAEDFAEVTLVLEAAAGGSLLDRAALHLKNANRRLQTQFCKKFRRRHTVELVKNP